MQRYPFYEIKRGTDLGASDTWNKRFQDIDLRLHARELDGVKIDEAVTAVTNVALQRLNDTFTPIITDAIERLSTVGALFVAQSESEHTVGLGEMSFVLTPATRAAYVVTDYVVIRSGAAALIAHVLSYDRANGLLTVDVDAASGSGTFDAWEIRVSAPPDIEHATRTDNPHQTTAAQVGAYTTAQVDAALALLNNALAEAISTAVTSLTSGVNARLARLANLSDLDDAATARGNLGLGDAATEDVVTSSDLLAKSGDGVVTAAEARGASEWVDLGNISGSVEIDANTGCRFHGVLVGNVVIDVANLGDSQPFEIMLFQDATGGRTVGWNARFKWINAVPAVATTASACAVIASGEGSWDANIVPISGGKGA